MARNVVGRVAVIATVMMSFVSGATTPKAAGGDSVEAIWRTQEFTLHVRATESYYTCSGLQTKIVTIMESFGARDVAVDMTCSGLTRNALATVAARTPIAADDETLRAASTFDSRAELVAKVRGESLPTPDTIPRFAAEWRTVSLGRNRRLDSQDCDLLREITNQILPRLSVRIVKKQSGCSHMSRVGPNLTLVVEALTQRV